MFDEVDKQSFSDREEEVLHFWKEKEIFKRSIENRKDQELFSFYDGPPFATGLPHYGHILAGTIKDVVLRHKTMKGYNVPRQLGWDCHGLPIETEIEKAFNLSGAASIEEFGIPKFNEECRKIVLRYTNEWKSTIERMGRWIDFDHVYHTMDKSFMESVWWVFKELYDKGLVYEGYKVMPFSAQLGTPLSNFEAGENYKDVDDPSLTVMFKLEEEADTYLLAWTTTPWTLVSNQATVVGADLDYAKVKDKTSGKTVILAKDRVGAYFKSDDDYEILGTLKGSDLEGKRYEPLFPYFAEQAQKGAFRVILGDYVTLEEGTGIVHVAPAFGETDFFACKEAKIDPVCPVDPNGKFTKEVADYEGLHVKSADKEIIRRLKGEEKVFHHGTIRHRYPFCWRTDTPLIYRAMRTWFVAVEKIKDKLLDSNSQVHWVPNHLKEGRFGKWLEGARDWAVSRNRYWGTPIPLWRADDGEIMVMGSVSELEELTGETIDDIHRHHIDSLTFTKNGKEFRRIPEVFDCWFESGSMPYAQHHYPFENRELIDNGFPADFIAEGLDQTRGWFYTLTVLATALFEKPAFKNVIVNGILLAADGNKMSKRLKNYPEPELVVNKYGADAIRLYLLNSPAVHANDLNFTERGVELVMRQVLIPLWNAYSFLVTYSRVNEWKPELMKKKPEAVIDQWILSTLHGLVQEVDEGMNGYDLNRAVGPLVGFVDQLTNWYIRRCRRRFWDSEASHDRNEAHATLYTVMLTLSKLSAPFVPFMADAMYRNLHSEEMPESVHLCDFPAYESDLRDEDLEKAMELVQKAVSLGHGLRKEHKLKVRQPLPATHIASADKQVLAFLKDQQHLVADELNVKEILFEEDESRFVQLKTKPNFRVLGKKVGKQMRAVQAAIAELSREQQLVLLNNEELTIVVEGNELTLTSEDVEVEREVQEGLIAANSGELTIALDTALSPELIREGLAREIVNKINTMRRDANFDVTDRVIVTMETTEEVKACFEQYHDYICPEVLATEVNFAACEGTEWDLNGEQTTIVLKRVAKVNS